MPAPSRTSGPNTKHSFALDSISLQREDQILLLLTLIIGAVVGLVVVAFILVTENLGRNSIPPTGRPGGGR